MNLVIDDAIEVGQVTKTNDTETRRPLGMGAAGEGLYKRITMLTIPQAGSC